MKNLSTTGWEWTAKATKQVTAGHKQSTHPDPENLTQSGLISKRQ